MPPILSALPSISLDSAGLVALADLGTISERTALTGTTWYSDILFLAPGLHTQQNASNVNGGEFPAAAAMTTGYVFRIENPATVSWLQRIGRPGHLASAKVDRPTKLENGLRTQLILLPNLLYMVGILLTLTSFAILAAIQDFWALGVLGMLVGARALNVVVFRRRAAVVGWKGKKEPGVQGDLLILLSQDRWVRLRGEVDDLKLVTAGQWVRDLEDIESFAVAFATLLVYGAAALAGNSSTVGSLIIALLLLVSVALLGVCNALTRDLHMFGCRVYRDGELIKYECRRDMADAMINEKGNECGWAVGMGLILPEGHAQGKAVM